MAFDLLRQFVQRDGPPQPISLDVSEAEVNILTANILESKRPSSMDRLSIFGRRASAGSARASLMLQLLHQTRQEEIGSSLFQVLSELNTELQLCAGLLNYESYCSLRSRVSRRLQRWLTTKIFLMLRDENGCCDIHALYDFFYSVGCMVKTRLTVGHAPTSPSSFCDMGVSS